MTAVLSLALSYSLDAGTYSDFGTFEGTWSVGGDPLAMQCKFITSRKTR